jgi:uncharacterized lipoprotein YajG
MLVTFYKDAMNKTVSLPKIVKNIYQDEEFREHIKRATGK